MPTPFRVQAAGAMLGAADAAVLLPKRPVAGSTTSVYVQAAEFGLGRPMSGGENVAMRIVVRARRPASVVPVSCMLPSLLQPLPPPPRCTSPPPPAAARGVTVRRNIYIRVGLQGGRSYPFVVCGVGDAVLLHTPPHRHRPACARPWP
jgi:hypothetical protein